MMEEQHASEGSVGSRDNHSRVPSQTLKLVLQKRMRKHRNRDNLEMQGDLHATSFRGEWTISYRLEDSYQSDRDQELENLRNQVRELESEARRRHRGRPTKRPHYEDSLGTPLKSVSVIQE